MATQLFFGFSCICPNCGKAVRVYALHKVGDHHNSPTGALHFSEHGCHGSHNPVPPGSPRIYVQRPAG